MITLIAPLPIKEGYRIFIITVIIFIFLIIILSRFSEKLKNIRGKTEDLDKRSKTMGDLNNIKLDITYAIKRGIQMDKKAFTDMDILNIIKIAIISIVGYIIIKALLR